MPAAHRTKLYRTSSSELIFSHVCYMVVQADILARQAKEKVRSESGPKDAVLSKRKRVADTSSSTNAKKAAKSVKKGPNQNK